ncbi:GNAT family N-acetyltransferase [Actinomadura parmotrematis]|uniref:GNAT family N-acetyltransferase n=1 Tax=Actinomadura parmotrematis TaxID=2864039 RepID=A0ABS7FWZ9_9ACTN|nr:GNAT family N-acetyltransferase [Actinomadura parmotrematis]MBW8484194.1 GNAT family N-acetyltransferase [Actinomadura parmotrematis]
MTTHDHDLSAEDTPRRGLPLPPAHPERPALVRLRAEPPTWAFGDLRLRRYRAADHPTVLDLHRAGLAQVGLRPGDGVYYEHDFFRMEEIYLGNGGEFLVGEVRDEIVAMGGLRRADLVPAGSARAAGGRAVTGLPGSVLDDSGPDVAEMVRLRVRPDLQGRGYGAVLVEALERRAAEIGYRLLRADTTERQRAALALYRRFGWTRTRRETIGGIVNVYLEKRLY